MNRNVATAECIHGMHEACACENACSCSCHFDFEKFVDEMDPYVDEDSSDD